MCRFYAWHLNCPVLRKNGRCDFQHDARVREAHDTMLYNAATNQESTIYEYKDKLVANYDADNLLHQKELRYKEEMLSKYPMKPTHKVQNRANYQKFTQELLEDLEEVQKAKIAESTVRMDKEEEKEDNK
jgi:formate dehydrogenase maturation protein FdhE